MKTIEERAKQICVDTFCSMCPKRVYTTCIWRHNTERSQPKCGISEYKGLIKDAYHAAIVQLQEQHEELTRWHDLKEELPDNNHCVLIKIADGPQVRIHIGSREGDVWIADGGFLFHADPASSIGFDGVVIGWREIHE